MNQYSILTLNHGMKREPSLDFGRSKDMNNVADSTLQWQVNEKVIKVAYEPLYEGMGQSFHKRIKHKKQNTNIKNTIYKPLYVFLECVIISIVDRVHCFTEGGGEKNQRRFPSGHAPNYHPANADCMREILIWRDTMNKRLLSADEVKQLLNVPDFRSIRRDKLVEFVSAIPEMDKEVAIKIIEQFPNFSEYAKCTVLHLYNMYDRLLQSNNASSGAVMAAYANVLNMLSSIASEESLTAQDRRWFAEKAVEVADKMAAFDKDNKGFLGGVFKVGVYILGGGLLLGAALLGINIRASRDAGS